MDLYLKKYTVVRIDWNEHFPSAYSKIVQAIDEYGDLLAEVPVTDLEFWSLPGDEFDSEELTDELRERLEEDYNEREAH